MSSILKTIITGDQDSPDREVAPICRGCNKQPDDLEEYREMGRLHDMSPMAFVALFEGTFNRKTGGFLCTPCYINAGSPTGGPSGKRWIAP